MHFDGALRCTYRWAATDVRHGLEGLSVDIKKPDIDAIRGHEFSCKIETYIGGWKANGTPYLIPFYNGAAQGEWMA